MARLEYAFLLSQAGQRADIRSGGTGKRCQSRAVPPDAPEWDSLLTMAWVGDDGSGTVHGDHVLSPLTVLGHNKRQLPSVQPHQFDAVPTPALFLKIESDRRVQIHDTDAAKMVELREADAARTAELLAADRCSDEWIEKFYQSGVVTYRLRTGGGRDADTLEMAEKRDSVQRIVDARNAGVRDSMRLEAEAKAKAKADSEAAVQAGKDLLAVWVEQAGSDLAKMRLAEGYATWVPVAADEFLSATAMVVLGEVAESKDGDGWTCIKNEPKESPSLFEMRFIKDARAAIEKLNWNKVHVSVELCRMEYSADGSEMHEEPETEIETEVELSVEFWPGYTVTRYYTLGE